MTVKLWDAQTEAERATLAGPRWVSEECAPAFSPDGSRIVSASEDETLKLWDAQTGAELATLVGHTGWVQACAFSPDGGRIVSASDDETLKIWDAQTGAQTCEYILGGFCQTAAWSPSGRDLAAGDGLAHLLILRLQNFSFGPALVTPWQHIPHRWIPSRKAEKGLHFGCPLCRMWSEIPESALSAVVSCPHCGERVQLNPFSINADWRPIAEAWGRNELQQSGQE